MEWIILTLVSAFFFSLHDIFRKKLLKIEHSLELLSVTFLTIFIIQLFLLPIINLSVDPLNLFLIIIRSISTAFALLFITKSLKHMEISSVAPISNLTPLFLVFISFIIGFETISYLQLLGIFLIILGSYFLQIHSHYLNPIKHLNLLKDKYIVYAILSAFLLAISAIISKFVLQTIEVMTYLFYSYLFMTIFFITTTFIIYDGIKDIKLGYSQGSFYVVLIALLFFFTEWSYFLAMAIPTALVSLIIPLKRVSTLFSVFLGGSLFKDHYILHKTLSSLVILFGVFLIVL